MSPYGYGKILDIDLSTGKVVKRDIDPEFAKKYIGGMGFSIKILYDEVGPEVDPLGPDNIVIFANGPLTGTQAPCSGRIEITTKSPLTGNIGTGNSGGRWGAQLKHAGYDLIIVRKQAEKPVYLWINDDEVELKEATHLWGKDTWQTTDILLKELKARDKADISVLAIGQAGENLVKFACPLNDYYHVASRTSAGAVMGSKKLKAIAVRGTGVVKVAQPEEFRKAVKEARERILDSEKAKNMPGGPPEPRQGSLDRGCLTGKNYQTGVLPRWIETRGLDVAKKYITQKDGTCYACPIPCFNRVEVKDGKYAGVIENRGQMPGVVNDWGAKLAIESLPAIWRCKELCQHLGMDYVAVSGAIGLCMELFQRGILTAKDTDGLELTWGNEDATIQMIQKIANRDGFGNLLAEGTVKAAETIGHGAERYAMVIKGMDMMIPDPRTGRRGWLFGSLTNPKGGDNVKTTHCHLEHFHPQWWADQFDMPDEVKAKIFAVPPETLGDTWEGKPTMCKWFEELYSSVNSFGICFFPAGFNMALGPTHLSHLYSAATGWSMTPQESQKAGERVFNLFKAYAVRTGLSRKDDDWPARFYEEPMPEGPTKGAILSRNTIQGLLDEYYSLRGWNVERGIPTRERLAELGLDDVAADLEKRGKLG